MIIIIYSFIYLFCLFKQQKSRTPSGIFGPSWEKLHKMTLSPCLQIKSFCSLEANVEVRLLLNPRWKRKWSDAPSCRHISGITRPAIMRQRLTRHRPVKISLGHSETTKVTRLPATYLVRRDVLVGVVEAHIDGETALTHLDGSGSGHQAVRIGDVPLSE